MENNYYNYDGWLDGNESEKTKYCNYKMIKKGNFFEEFLITKRKGYETITEKYIKISEGYTDINILINYMTDVINEDKNILVFIEDSSGSTYDMTAKEYLNKLNKQKDKMLWEQEVLNNPELQEQIINEWNAAAKIYHKYYRIVKMINDHN